MRLCLFLLSILVPASGWSQTGRPVPRIEPGSDSLVAGRVAEGTDTLVIVEGDDADLRMFGLIFLETRGHRRNGVDVLTRIERIPGAGDRTVAADSFVVVQGSLAPVSAAPLGEAGRQWVQFGRRSVVQGGQGGEVARIPIAGTPFYGNSLDVVLRSLPLRRGFRALLPLYGTDARAISDVLVTVEELEDVRSASGELCRAWRVDVADGEHGGTYWIDSTSFSLVRYRPPADAVHLLRIGCGGRSGAAASD
jgi:hypothetical protein